MRPHRYLCNQTWPRQKNKHGGWSASSPVFTVLPFKTTVWEDGKPHYNYNTGLLTLCSLLFLIGYCGTSVWGTLIGHHNYQLHLTRRIHHRGANPVRGAEKKHIDTPIIVFYQAANWPQTEANLGWRKLKIVSCVTCIKLSHTICKCQVKLLLCILTKKTPKELSVIVRYFSTLTSHTCFLHAHIVLRQRVMKVTPIWGTSSL